MLTNLAWIGVALVIWWMKCARGMERGMARMVNIVNGKKCFFDRDEVLIAELLVRGRSRRGYCSDVYTSKQCGMGYYSLDFER